jgi:hypothetical protein
MPQPAGFQPWEGLDSGEPLRAHGGLGALAGGFRTGQFVLVESTTPHVFHLTTSLCVAAALDGAVVFIDGGNSIQPYAIARLCKTRRIDARAVLSRIRVARAFMAHQLVALVDERLDAEVRKVGARTVVVSCLFGMFFDDGVPWAESFQLAKRCLEEVGAVARERDCRAVVTHYSSRPLSRRFSEMASQFVDARLRMREEGGALVAQSGAAEERFLVGRGRAQRTIDQFTGGWPHGPHAADI